MNVVLESRLIESGIFHLNLLSYAAEPHFQQGITPIVQIKILDFILNEIDFLSDCIALAPAGLPSFLFLFCFVLSDKPKGGLRSPSIFRPSDQSAARPGCQKLKLCR